MHGVDNTYPTLERYIEAKLDMLRKDFHIRLTKSEMEHARSLKSEIQVDNFCREMFSQKL